MSETAVNFADHFSARVLLDILAAEGVVDRETILTALSGDIDLMSLDEFEVWLTRTKFCADDSLRLIKAEALGVAALPPNANPVRVEKLGRNQVAAIKAIPVDVGSEPGLVFTNPSPENRALASQVLGLPETRWRAYVTTAGHWQELFETLYSPEEVAEANAPKLESVRHLMADTIRLGGSDFHIHCGNNPGIRIHGKLTRQKYAKISADWMYEQVRELLGEEKYHKFLVSHDVDQSYAFENHRFRLNYGRNRRGPTLVGRLIPTDIPTPTQLGLPESIVKFTELERGLVLVTGPTGSGKSTTLASLLNHIAESRSDHVITLEDPVEFVLTGNQAMVSQRELGQDFSDFATALRQSLRQDPDVILIGELRDQETIETAIHAAETGHLVFGTLHAYDAPSTVDRLVSTFPPEQQEGIRNQLSYTLAGVVSQTLCRRRSGGRVAAHEIMVGTPAIQANLARPDGIANLRQAIETGSADGMQTLEQSLGGLVRRGLITVDEARYRSRRKKEIEKYLH